MIRPISSYVVCRFWLFAESCDSLDSGYVYWLLAVGPVVDAMSVGVGFLSPLLESSLRDCRVGCPVELVELRVIRVGSGRASLAKMSLFATSATAPGEFRGVCHVPGVPQVWHQYVPVVKWLVPIWVDPSSDLSSSSSVEPSVDV